MKKFVVLSGLILSAILISGCSIKRTKPARDVSSIKEETEIDDVFEKNVPPMNDHVSETTTNTDKTHELAEANADDVAIKQAVGSKDIDEELAPLPEEQIPYARDFLVHKKTKRMQFWIEYFTQKQRDRFQRFINNGEEYRHHIEEIFVKAGLPKELYFVGLIESGYYLGARSHAAAVGPWQFIPGTGKRYGLSITKEIDERQDLFKASRAAAMYFKDLHNIFSSWELALAAYNAGEYGIIRRILRHGTRDFYVLSKNKQLPSETINYVPKVLAAMHIVNNAEKYGFTLPKKTARLFDHTELRAIKKNLPLHVIANKIDVDVSLLKKLNPELRGNRTPRFLAGTYYLRVPKSQYTYRLIEVESDSNIAAIGARPESRKQMVRRTAAVEKATEMLNTPVKVATTPSYHTVKRGETLLTISRKYKMTAREIASANHLKSWKTKVRVGQRLALNDDEVAVKFASPLIKMTKRPVVYRVKAGDKLKELARIFGKDVSDIKEVNNLHRNKIVVGQKIVLPDSKKGIYTVKYGDHLTKVSRALNQPVEEIKKLNSLSKNKLYPGQKLIVDMD
ncbi:MAG: LysM peptidoglycan-binding domain-containing protein [Bacteriovoracaceae bacterium]